MRYWTEEERAEALELYARGFGITKIAIKLGRATSTVFNLLKPMTAEQKARKRLREKAWRQRYDGFNVGHREFRQAPCPVAIAERDYRVGLPDRDLTAAFFGDPKPGYSALDRR